MSWSVDGSTTESYNGSYASSYVGGGDGGAGGAMYTAPGDMMYTMRSPVMMVERSPGGPSGGWRGDGDDGGGGTAPRRRWGVRGNRRMLTMLAIIGLGTLMPFNILINAVDYFDFLFPGRGTEFYAAIAFVLPQPLLMWLTTRSRKHWTSPSSATRCLIVVIFVWQAAMMLAIPIAGRFLPRAHVWWIVLGAACFLGAQSCLLQPSLFAFSSILPPQYVRAMMAGQAASAVFACSVRVATKAAVPDPHDSAMVFFATSATLLLLCAVVFVCLRMQPMTRYLLAKAASGTMLEDDLMSVAVSEYSDDGHADGRRVSYCSVLNRLKLQATGLFLVLMVSFMLYPGMLTSFWYHGTWSELTVPGVRDPCGGSWFRIAHGAAGVQMQSWWPIIMIAVACVFDAVGRMLSGMLRCCIGSKTVLVRPAASTFVPRHSCGPVLQVVGLLRFVFIPLFIWYNQGMDRRVFSDTDAMFIVAAYALSNSSLASIAMRPPPSSKFTEAEQAMASLVLLTVFRAGIFVGSFLALGVRQIHMPALQHM